MKSPYILYKAGYIQLPNLNLGVELPKKLEVEGDELFLKSEFHISLVWVDRLADIVDEQNKEKIKAEMIEEFNKFTENNSLVDWQLSDKLRFVKHDEKKTIIIMAQIPNIEAFFDILRQKYGISLPTQPTHITLYKLLIDESGIGILSDEELQNISKPIDLPVVRNKLL